MPWQWCTWGEWHSFPLKKIAELTSGLPHQFLMAEGVNDEELRELETFPRLGGLAIVSPHITKAAVPTLQTFSHLRELILCGPPITDDFLLELAVMTTLQEITLVHTACTVEGVRKFLESVSACQVYRGGADSIYPASLRRELQLFVCGTFTRRAAADPPRRGF